MSIAADTLHADMTLELRRDLAATRNALQRSEEANAALRRERERHIKVLRLMQAEVTASLLKIENMARELKS